MCGVGKLMSNLKNEDKLMQYVMGLNEGYNIVKNKILMMDPLPYRNKAYSMALQMEKQREVDNVESVN